MMDEIDKLINNPSFSDSLPGYLRKKADELLDDLNEENYSKLKNLQSTARKNYF